MKRVLSYIMFVVLLLAAGCMDSSTGGSADPPAANIPDGYYGISFDLEKAVPSNGLMAMFAEDQTEVTGVTLEGLVPASCTHSGCWMDLSIDETATMNVSFRNGDFTIPLDAAGKVAVITGTAYRELVPVERLRAYARDNGLSEEEIAAITTDDWEYTFVADGVFLKDK